MKALNPAVSCAQFDAFLNRNIAKIAPVTAYYREYEHLYQVSTIADYVARMKTLCSQIEREYSGTIWHHLKEI